MSYLVLARKYRPQTFSEVVEQEHVTRTLTHAIASQRVAHAILFSGPRGTGKTTVARILAKAMNCQNGPTSAPCNQCRFCIEVMEGNSVDVLEIDGASNNSVDQVRELRENIKYMPARSRYKIYIIDEVHMLSTPAFNALLKTLEEPPGHVMFMFATTEAHRIPVTILSRCQRHDFRRIKADAIIQHMAELCRKEGFQIEAASLQMIAREAAGSIRDGLSLLDQVLSSSGKSISHPHVLDILGGVDRAVLDQLGDAVVTGDLATVLSLIDQAYERGQDLKRLYEDLLAYFRDLLVVKLGDRTDHLVDLPGDDIARMKRTASGITGPALHQILDRLFRHDAAIRWSHHPKLALEVAFIRLLQENPVLPIETLIEKLDAIRREMITVSPNPEALPNETGTQPPPRESEFHSPSGAEKSAAERVSQTQLWESIVRAVSETHPSLAITLKKCRLKSISEKRLVIETAGNGFTVNQIRRERNIETIKAACGKVGWKVKQVVLKNAEDDHQKREKKKGRQSELKQQALNHPLVAEAIQIFNGTLIDIKLKEEDGP
jgi:DNA polymerase-3 subunit gamma/tau